MKVLVKLQGTLPDHYQGSYPENGLELDLEGAISVTDLVIFLGIPQKSVSLVSVNGMLARSDDIIPDGAKIKLMQHLGGGQANQNSINPGKR